MHSLFGIGTARSSQAAGGFTDALFDVTVALERLSAIESPQLAPRKAKRPTSPSIILAT